jgi:RNA polymerase sigma factor (sigma-70 family)
VKAPSPSDDQLWNHLIDGEEAAFSKLFERYYPTLLGYGKSFITDADRVQDCTQDVFADIWLYRASLDRSAMVKPYLLSCIRKRMARLYSRDRIFRHTDSLDDVEFSISFTVEDRLIANEETASRIHLLNQQINALPPRQREILFLRYHQGLTTEQVAEILSINYQSASNLLHRALIQLRRELKGNAALLVLLLFQLV